MQQPQVMQVQQQVQQPQKPKRYFKLLREDLCHFGFKYTPNALNVDFLPFRAEGRCEAGGLYFFSEDQLFGGNNYFASFVDLEHIRYICEVTIPDDALVYHEEGKSKASKLILGDLREAWEDLRFCFNLCKYQMMWLTEAVFQKIKRQTFKICLAAVKNNGWLLEFVKKQTPRICLAAVRSEGMALQFVKKQTPRICRAAVRHTGTALQFVKDQTYEICLSAVKNCYHALKHVRVQTPEICLFAVKKRGKALCWVKNQTPEICMAAVQQDGTALLYVKNQTYAICLAAVEQNSAAFYFVKKVTPLNIIGLAAD